MIFSKWIKGSESETIYDEKRRAADKVSNILNDKGIPSTIKTKRDSFIIIPRSTKDEMELSRLLRNVTLDVSREFDDSGVGIFCNDNTRGNAVNIEIE